MVPFPNTTSPLVVPARNAAGEGEGEVGNGWPARDVAGFLIACCWRRFPTTAPHRHGSWQQTVEPPNALTDETQAILLATGSKKGTSESHKVCFVLLCLAGGGRTALFLTQTCLALSCSGLIFSGVD
jgi:hypothetical protein